MGEAVFLIAPVFFFRGGYLDAVVSESGGHDVLVVVPSHAERVRVESRSIFNRNQALLLELCAFAENVEHTLGRKGGGSAGVQFCPLDRGCFGVIIVLTVGKMRC